MGKQSAKESNQSAQRVRYSDEELKEFEKIINEKLKAARKELKYYNDAIRHYDDHGTDDTAHTFKSVEDSSIHQEKELMHQMAARQKKYIKHLENALIRIENKTYGVCRVTGELISKERLKIVPHATLSIDAKKKRRQ
jgi:RNA polymerase-binding transcription factor DksA